MRKIFALLMIATIASSAMGAALVKEDFTDGVLNDDGGLWTIALGSNGNAAIGTTRRDIGLDGNPDTALIIADGSSWGSGFATTGNTSVAIGADEYLVTSATYYSDRGETDGSENIKFLQDIFGVNANGVAATVYQPRMHFSKTSDPKEMWSTVNGGAVPGNGQPGNGTWAQAGSGINTTAELDVVYTGMFGFRADQLNALETDIEGKGMLYNWEDSNSNPGALSVDGVQVQFLIRGDNTNDAFATGASALAAEAGILSYTLGVTKTTDFNGDFATDTLDLFVWQGSNGAAGTKTVFDGDSNNDATVDTLDLFDWQGNNGTSHDEIEDNAIPNVVYDATTGLLTMDVDGKAGVIGVVVFTDPTNLVDGTANDLPGGWLSLTGTDNIQWNWASSFAVLDANTTYQLGQLVAGLSAADFGQVQYGSGLFTDVTVVPEPATMSLLAIGGLVAIRRRRRA